MIGTTSTTKKHKQNQARTKARTLAIQALYQNEINDEKFSIQELKQKILKFNDTFSNNSGNKPDEEFLTMLLKSAVESQENLDIVIGKHLSDGHKLGGIGHLLKVILRLGTAELQPEISTPKNVAIKEYIRLTGQFVGEKETALVNAVLDKIN